MPEADLAYEVTRLIFFLQNHDITLCSRVRGSAKYQIQLLLNLTFKVINYILIFRVSQRLPSIRNRRLHRRCVWFTANSFHVNLHERESKRSRATCPWYSSDMHPDHWNSIMWFSLILRQEFFQGLSRAKAFSVGIHLVYATNYAVVCFFYEQVFNMAPQRHANKHTRWKLFYIHCCDQISLFSQKYESAHVRLRARA